ncbi:hypothetical protein [Stutzerimonas decontaminans]|uniref:Uncharacterized protein n=1 Tax=Stutzerimonas stutzeri TaxID=316 RepID=A0A023WZ55_STUST|nr:hypothetical protein [Stutzerimonas decontaminans]AHY45246.1 hypothetical protein UIB01_22395 [Stutzerimonas decontaminans]
MSDSSKGGAPAPAKYSDIVADGGMDPRSAHVEQQLRSTSPADWQTVPVNPTIEMIAALGFNGDVPLAVGHASACEELTAQYRAMLACAPAAPLAKTPTAYLRASDLERLAPNNVAGCAASLSKEPGNGLVAIYTEAFSTSALAEALAAFVALAEERERELGDLSSEMRECLQKGRAALSVIQPQQLGLVETLQNAFAISSNSGSGKFALTLSFENLAAMQACRRAVECALGGAK